MDKNDRNLQDNSWREKLKQAYGFSDHQLLQEFERAKEISKQQSEEEEEKDGFRKLSALIEARGVVPSCEGGDKKGKRARIKHIWRPLLAAVLVGGVLIGTGITVLGKRFYRYDAREVSGGKIFQYRNDGESFIYSNDINASYAKNVQDSGIPVLIFSYLPPDMVFKSLKLSEKHANIEFDCNGKSVHFVQAIYDVENVSTNKSDCRKVDEIYNECLDIKIPIYENELENGFKEYSCDFTFGSGYYSVSGILSKDLFIRIIENLTYYTEEENGG